MSDDFEAVDASLTRKVKDTVAGFVGGAVQVLVGQPFDLVKVRTQTGQYSSPLQAFTQTLKNEGPLAFYKGTAAPLFGVGACVSIQFYAFHEAKRQLQTYSKTTSLSPAQFYTAGAFAGVVNTVVTAPVEQLRILLQTQTAGTYAGPRDAIHKIYQSQGLARGIFRGSFITALREAQAYGVWFMTYEYLISQFSKSHNGRNDIPTWKLVVSGALAGEALWLASYPIDVVKTRIQSDGFGKNGKYSGSVSVIADIWKSQGFAGFWRGIVPTLLRALPASSCTFASVELMLRLLG